MKKLLEVIFLALLLSGNAYTHENPRETKLSCIYIETFYRNWDNNQFGETIINDTAVKNIYFNISKKDNNKYGFETNMQISNLQSVKGEKFSSKVDDNNYFFYISKNTSYTSIELNRYNGKLVNASGHTNDDSKYLIQEFYNCEKAKQKF